MKRFSDWIGRRITHWLTKVCSRLLAEAFSSVNFPVLPFIDRRDDGSVREAERLAERLIQVNAFANYGKSRRKPHSPAHAA